MIQLIPVAGSLDLLMYDLDDEQELYSICSMFPRTIKEFLRAIEVEFWTRGESGSSWREMKESELTDLLDKFDVLQMNRDQVYGAGVMENGKRAFVLYRNPWW